MARTYKIPEETFQNYSTLSKIIILSGYSIKNIADQLSLTTNELLKRLDDNTLFTIKEVGLLSTFLPLSRYQILGYIDGIYNYRTELMNAKKTYTQKLRDNGLNILDKNGKDLDVQDRSFKDDVKHDKFDSKNIDLNDIDYFVY